MGRFRAWLVFLLIFLLILFPYYSFAQISYSQLQDAANNVSPGDTIVVADDMYHDPGIITIGHNNNCTQANPCTIRAESTHGVSITGNTSGFRVRGNWWILDGFEVRNQTDHPNLDGWLELYSARNVVIDNFKFTGQGGGWDFYIVLGNPGNIETGQNVTVQNSEFANGTDLDRWVFNWNIRDNNHNHTGFNFLNNHIHDLQFQAGTQFGGNHLGNSVGRTYNNGGFDCNGLFQGNIWENITGSETQNSGLFHIKCNNVRLRGETFRNNDRNSIRLRQGDGNVIEGSLFENNTYAVSAGDVSVSSGRNHRIVNNIFLAKGGSKNALIVGRGCHLASDRPATCSSQNCQYEATTGTIIANNTFVGYDDQGIEMGKTPTNPNCTIDTCPSGNQIENDIFYHDNGGIAIDVQSGCSTQTVDDNLFFLQGGASTDIQGTGAVLADPQFVALGSDNLRLQDTSPAIDVGHNVTGTTLDSTDRVGTSRPQGVEFDFGAFEFIPGAPDPEIAVSVSFRDTSGFDVLHNTIVNGGIGFLSGGNLTQDTEFDEFQDNLMSFGHWENPANATVATCSHNVDHASTNAPPTGCTDTITTDPVLDAPLLCTREGLCDANPTSAAFLAAVGSDGATRGTLVSPVLNAAAVETETPNRVNITMTPFSMANIGGQGHTWDTAPIRNVDITKINCNGTASAICVDVSPRTITGVQVVGGNTVQLTLETDIVEGEVLDFDADERWCEDNANLGRIGVNAQCLAATDFTITNNVAAEVLEALFGVKSGGTGSGGTFQ